MDLLPEELICYIAVFGDVASAMALSQVNVRLHRIFDKAFKTLILIKQIECLESKI